MSCFECSEEPITQNSYKLLSNNTLNEEKTKLKKEAREQCCFCMLFSVAAVGTSAVSATTHGTTLASDIPAIIVSLSSAAMCLKQVTNKTNSINTINTELEKREKNNVKYVDNFNNLAVYNTTNDSLHPIHHPVL